MNNNPIFEIISKFLGGQTFGNQFFNNQNINNEKNQNPAFNNYPFEAYQNNNVQDSSFNTNTNNNQFENIMPMLLSILGKNSSLSSLTNIFKTNSTDNQNIKKEDNKNPPGEILL